MRSIDGRDVAGMPAAMAQVSQPHGEIKHMNRHTVAGSRNAGTDLPVRVCWFMVYAGTEVRRYRHCCQDLLAGKDNSPVTLTLQHGQLGVQNVTLMRDTAPYNPLSRNQRAAGLFLLLFTATALPLPVSHQSPFLEAFVEI